jgi:hypothetical protein
MAGVRERREHSTECSLLGPTRRSIQELEE